MSIKYNKGPLNGPSVHKIYEHLPLQDHPKFTQIWIFGLKTNHLATLLSGTDVMIFKKFRCKIWHFFPQTTASFLKKYDHNIGF
jgi:hypothetical protein